MFDQVLLTSSVFSHSTTEPGTRPSEQRANSARLSSFRVTDSKQAYFVTKNNLLRLVWLVEAREPAHAWEFAVDAVTGDILEQLDLVVHEEDPSFNVWPYDYLDPRGDYKAAPK